MIGLIGAGGFGKEIYHHMVDDGYKNIYFFVDKQFANENTKSLDDDLSDYKFLITIADTTIRNNICNKLNVQWISYRHKSSIILDKKILLSEGSIMCANTVITHSTTIGSHLQMNVMSVIGHDCQIGNFVTLCPGAKISGNCVIGDRVFFGANSSVKEKVKICSDVIIGIGCVVTKNISEPGVYVGCPAKKIK